MRNLQLRKILVTGADGQLAKAVASRLQGVANILYTNREQLDITDKNALRSFLHKNKPEIILNTAAYTAVDAAENNSSQAFAINAEAVAEIAEICKEINSKLIHVSTDYVFDGKAGKPYAETDIPNPVTIYGKSKLAGEEAILKSGIQEYAIVRTSWLYSNYGNNFYKTMLRIATQKKSISVVNDQKGSPTYAPNLAVTLLEIAANLNSGNSGIYHYSDNGITTWYEFAKEIFRVNGEDIEVNPIATKEYPTLAQRPAYSVLDTQKVEKVFGIKVFTWQDGVEKCRKELP